MARKLRKYRLLAAMNIRKEPDIYSDRLAVRREGSVVDVYAVKNDWLEVKWDGGKGYILFGNGKYAEEIKENKGVVKTSETEDSV